MDHFDKELQDLVAKGKVQGCLTYDEVTSYLPDEAVDPEKLDNLLIALDEAGIELVQIRPRSRSSSISTHGPPERRRRHPSDPLLPRSGWKGKSPGFRQRTFPAGTTTRSGCTSAKWPRFPSCPANRKSRWPRRSRSPEKGSAARWSAATWRCGQPSLCSPRSTADCCRSIARSKSR